MSRLPWRLILAVALVIRSLTVHGQYDNESPSQAYPPLEHFLEITQRPLFEESRRPRQPEEPSEASATAQALREDWRLTGVVWEGAQPLALFSERRGEGRHRLKTGMYLDSGWQLEEIQADAVTLTDGTQQLVLELREPRLLIAEQEISSSDSHPEPAEPKGQANAEVQ